MRSDARTLLASTAAALALLACEPSPFEPAERVAMTVPTPPALTARTIEDDRLILLATVGGRSYEGVRRGAAWEITATIPPGQPVDVELLWCYRDAPDGADSSQECPLPLGSLESTARADANGDVVSFDFDAFTFADEDGDGAPNHIELRDDFDPRNSNLCPDCRTDVDLTIVRRNLRPDIDGNYFNGEGESRVDVWFRSQLKDREGPLFIDTPLSGAGVDNGSDESEPPKWGAMHDGRDLFVFVLGEGEPKSHHFDSSDPRDDDSIELHLLSPARAVSLIIPVRDASGDDNVNARGLIASDDDSPGVDPDMDPSDADRFADAIAAGDVEVVACKCGGERDFYELRLSLDWLGLGSGDVLELEVQLNEDDDGGATDARWGWRALAGSGRDFTSGGVNGGLPGRALIE